MATWAVQSWHSPVPPCRSLSFLPVCAGNHHFTHGDGHEGSSHATPFSTSLTKNITTLGIPTWRTWQESQCHRQAHDSSEDEQCRGRNAGASPCAACTGTVWLASICWEARARGEELGKGLTGLNRVRVFWRGMAQSQKGDVSGALHAGLVGGCWGLGVEF